MGSYRPMKVYGGDSRQCDFQGWVSLDILEISLQVERKTAYAPSIEEFVLEHLFPCHLQP